MTVYALGRCNENIFDLWLLVDQSVELEARDSEV